MKLGEKISIIGGTGTGKTTLSKNLSKILNIPAYHLDAVNYFEDWVPRNKQERDEMILKKIEEESWIIDGTYMNTLEKRISASDTIIFLDYSTFARLKGIFSRYLKNKNVEKEEIPGCKEQMNWFLIKQTFKYIKKSKKIRELLKKYDKKNIIIFKNRKKLNIWFESNFNEKINVK